MNHRERVLAAIAHKESDKIPIDLGSTPSSSISAIAYNALTSYLGLDERAKVYDVVQQVAEPSEAILERFEVSAIDIGRAFTRADEYWYETSLANNTKALYPFWFTPVKEEDNSYTAYNKENLPIAKMPEGATFFDQTYFPYIEGYPSNYDELPTMMERVLWSAFVHAPWD